MAASVVGFYACKGTDHVLTTSFDTLRRHCGGPCHLEKGELFLTRPFEEERTRRLPIELKIANSHGREYVATLDDLPISLTVAHQLCQDSMSGVQYPARVRLVVCGEGIVIGPVVTTRMACASALMNQENRFLSLLDQVTSVRIGQHGELLLSTPQGSTIRAFQSDHDSP